MALARTLVSTFLGAVLVIGGGCSSSCPTSTTPAATGVPLSEPMGGSESLTVTSTTFANGAAMPAETIFSGFGCSGGNQSPALAWSGAPANTQSYAIVVHDPDAPTGVGFFHFIAFNIPATVTSLEQNGAASLPAGAVASRTDFGAPGYGGPCPPPGAPHRYIFTVYALDVPSIDLDASASGALVRFMLRGHTLAYGRLTGTYERAN